MILRHVFDKFFRFPDISDQKDRFQLDKKGDQSGIQMVSRQMKALEVGCVFTVGGEAYLQP
jgi:hypothetical protein